MSVSSHCGDLNEAPSCSGTPAAGASDCSTALTKTSELCSKGASILLSEGAGTDRGSAAAPSPTGDGSGDRGKECGLPDGLTGRIASLPALKLSLYEQISSQLRADGLVNVAQQLEETLLIPPQTSNESLWFLYNRALYDPVLLDRWLVGSHSASRDGDAVRELVLGFGVEGDDAAARAAERLRRDAELRSKSFAGSWTLPPTGIPAQKKSAAVAANENSRVGSKSDDPMSSAPSDSPLGNGISVQNLGRTPPGQNTPDDPVVRRDLVGNPGPFCDFPAATLSSLAVERYCVPHKAACTVCIINGPFFASGDEDNTVVASLLQVQEGPTADSAAVAEDGGATANPSVGAVSTTDGFVLQAASGPFASYGTSLADVGSKLPPPPQTASRFMNELHGHGSKVASRPGLSRIWNRIYRDHSGPICALAAHPNNALFVSGSLDKTIRVFDLSKLKYYRAIHNLTDNWPITSLCMHPSGTSFYAGTTHHLIRLFDTNRFQCLTSLVSSSETHAAGVNCFACSPDGAVVFSGSDDGSVRMWDCRSGRLINILPSCHNGYPIQSLDLDNSGLRLLSSGVDGICRFFDLRVGLESHRANIGKPGQPVKGVFLLDDSFVVSICVNDPQCSSVAVIRSNTGVPVGSLQKHPGVILDIFANRVPPRVDGADTLVADVAFATACSDGKSRLFELR